MTKPHRPQSATAQAGTTLTEYAVLLGLVGVVSIVGLKALGISTHNLLANTGTGLEKNSTLSVLSPVQTASSKTAPLKGYGYYSIVKDPVTGLPTLQLGAGTQGVSTNVTSVDGKFNTLGSLMLAKKLERMAESATDPALKSYYGQIAELSYYLGGAEGELDDVPELNLPVTQYNNGNALKDVITYSNQLQQLLQNPPPNFQQTKDFKKVMPLAVNVYNIAQNYKNNLSEFIQPDGSILSFGTVAEGTSGTGQAGSVLTNDSLVAGDQASNTHYDNVVSYNDIKTLSQEVLSDNKVDSVPVESTLTDATAVDTAATIAKP